MAPSADAMEAWLRTSQDSASKGKGGKRGGGLDSSYSRFDRLASSLPDERVALPSSSHGAQLDALRARLATAGAAVNNRTTLQQLEAQQAALRLAEQQLAGVSGPDDLMRVLQQQSGLSPAELEERLSGAADPSEVLAGLLGLAMGHAAGELADGASARALDGGALAARSSRARRGAKALGRAAPRLVKADEELARLEAQLKEGRAMLQKAQAEVDRSTSEVSSKGAETVRLAAELAPAQAQLDAAGSKADEAASGAKQSVSSIVSDERERLFALESLSQRARAALRASNEKAAVGFYTQALESAAAGEERAKLLCSRAQAYAKASALDLAAADALAAAHEAPRWAKAHFHMAHVCEQRDSALALALAATRYAALLGALLARAEFAAAEALRSNRAEAGEEAEAEEGEVHPLEALLAADGHAAEEEGEEGGGVSVPSAALLAALSARVTAVCALLLALPPPDDESKESGALVDGLSSEQLAEELADVQAALCRCNGRLVAKHASAAVAAVAQGEGARGANEGGGEGAAATPLTPLPPLPPAALPSSAALLAFHPASSPSVPPASSSSPSSLAARLEAARQAKQQADHAWQASPHDAAAARSALPRYAEALALAHSVWRTCPFGSDEAAQAAELAQSLLLNRSACNIAALEHAGCVADCDMLLQVPLEPLAPPSPLSPSLSLSPARAAKVLLRRAAAHRALGESLFAARDEVAADAVLATAHAPAADSAGEPDASLEAVGLEAGLAAGLVTGLAAGLEAGLAVGLVWREEVLLGTHGEVLELRLSLSLPRGVTDFAQLELALNDTSIEVRVQLPAGHTHGAPATRTVHATLSRPVASEHARAKLSKKLARLTVLLPLR